MRSSESPFIGPIRRAVVEKVKEVLRKEKSLNLDKVQLDGELVNLTPAEELEIVKDMRHYPLIHSLKRWLTLARIKFLKNRRNPDTNL